MIKALTASSLKEEVTKPGIVIVDFWAPWCGPCRAFHPILEKVSEANPDISFTSVNTEESQDLAMEYGIQAIPTLMFFRDGILLFQQAGALPELALNKLIEQIKLLDMNKVLEEVVHTP